MWLQEVWSSGIDWSLPGNGGPECAAYLSPKRKTYEFIAGMTLAVASLIVGAFLHERPKYGPIKTNVSMTYLLLVSMAFTYLAEIGYKFYTNQAIFIFNPCHCLCVVQMFILHRLCQVVQQRKEVDATLIYTFRLHLFWLHGPMVAVFFPVTNTLFLPGEVATYWIEHALLLIIPLYLLILTDLTVPMRSWTDFFGWGLMAYGIWGMFHFIVLQFLASMTLANLDSMLCPAITDPFRGPDYRSWAILHQLVMVLGLGYLINKIGNTDSPRQKIN